MYAQSFEFSSYYVFSFQMILIGKIFFGHIYMHDN